MGQRHKARQVALELLYAADVGGTNVDGNLNLCASLHNLDDDGAAFARRLFDAVRDNLPEIDDTIKKHLENWDMDRLAIVDKNVLRLGVAELLFVPETPVKVAIDEAIELAKKFGSAESGRFVNGVLDAVRLAQLSSKG